MIQSARWVAHRRALATVCALVAVGCGDAATPSHGSSGAQEGSGGGGATSTSSSGGEAGTGGGGGGSGAPHGPVDAQGLNGAAHGKSESYQMFYAVGQPSSSGKSKSYRLKGGVAGAGDQ